MTGITGMTGIAGVAGIMGITKDDHRGNGDNLVNMRNVQLELDDFADRSVTREVMERQATSTLRRVEKSILDVIICKNPIAEAAFKLPQ